MIRKDKAVIGSQEQQKANQLAVDTTSRHFDGTVKKHLCIIGLQDLLPTYSNASQLSKDDLSRLPLAVSPTFLETSCRIAAVTDLPTIIQDPNSNVHFFNTHVKSVACCQNNFVRIVMNHKQ